MLRFNRFLREAGVKPENTAILLHTPPNQRFAALLPWFADAEPELFNAYQSAHNPRATSTLRQRDYVASFVRVEGGLLVFVGVYRNRGCVELSNTEIGQKRTVRRMIEEFGIYAEFETPQSGSWPWFQFELTDILANYRGRIQIKPRLVPAYVRLAENLDAEIVALSAENVLSAAAPEWRDFIVSGPEVRLLPLSWQARLREWRGIYLIVDESDGQRYVGSAYGEQNILGRWQEHTHGNVGVTEQLRYRDTSGFRFSILERVSPDMLAEDVIALEHTWMARLHTRQFGLNA